MDKDLKKIVRRIERQGFVVVPAGKHQKVKNSSGQTIYTLPTSPSGSLWRVRLISELRKRGLID
jgi:predicted RNA binding protein YcfA (HicA-like mRNA interferase family)